MIQGLAIDIYIFWSPSGNGKQAVWDSQILWSDEDYFRLTGPNSNRKSSRQASVPFTRFLVEYMGRARSLDKLSSKWAVA